MIQQIFSTQDPRVAGYRHVGDHEWLRARALFVAEGRLVVKRLLLNGRYAVESVLVTPPALEGLHTLLKRLQSPVFVATPALLAEIAGFNFHRGCLALAIRRPQDPLEDVAIGPLLIGLEAVGNPDNVGGLFRTAAALGASGVVVDDRSGDPFYRKALRTSMGAVLDLPFTTVAEWRGTFDRLRARGRRIVALTPDPSAESLADFARSSADQPLILMVGAEGPGLTRTVLESADCRVRIPISAGVDSLNVTSAAAIALARIAEVRSSIRD